MIRRHDLPIGADRRQHHEIGAGPLAADLRDLRLTKTPGKGELEVVTHILIAKYQDRVFFERGADGLAPISLSAIERALENLRLNFDLIIVDSQAIMSDAFGMALSTLADGSVMVIEAERTRAPVAKECKRLIESSGGRLLGAVMNRRRLYIPDRLYRLFYQRVSI